MRDYAPQKMKNRTQIMFSSASSTLILRRCSGQVCILFSGQNKVVYKRILIEILNRDWTIFLQDRTIHETKNGPTFN